MADIVSAGRRSWIMSRIRSKDTSPERAVRSLVHRMGYRFRLHRGDLPGRPDLVFPALGKAIFVHGCFWHGHCCREGRRRPKSNQGYWLPKIESNRKRDQRARRALRRAGWQVLVVWECQAGDPDLLTEKIGKFLRR